jgi:hypothetical protein
MKIKKIILLITSSIFVIIGLVIFGIFGFNHILFKNHKSLLAVTTDYQPINFNWINKEINGFQMEKAAMVIPSKIQGISRSLYFQFDTGAPNTIIYEHTLKSLENEGVIFHLVTNGSKNYVKELTINLGGSETTLKMIEVSFRSKSANEKDPRLLGSIGMDFIRDKLIEINFKNKLIQFHEKREDWMLSGNNKFTDFENKGNRIVFPVKINGEKKKLLYDSGCSSFGIITVQKLYQKYSKENSKVSRIEFISWGRADKWDIPIVINRVNSDSEIHISDTKLVIGNINHLNSFNIIQNLLFSFIEIDGWLGNVPFLKSSLIIDASQNEFLVVNEI